MLQRSPYYLMDAGSTQSDESESLQADVMRFMAILGLCLMVIFALVQSLPSVPVDRETVREQAAQQSALLREITELREQVTTLGFAVQQAESDTSEVTGTAELQKQALEAQAQRIIELEALVSRSEMLNIELSEQVSDMTQLLDVQQREPTQQQVEQRPQEQGQLQAAGQAQELAEAQAAQQAQELTDMRERLSQQATDQQGSPDTESIFNSDETAAEPAVESSQEEGFRLRFATDTAFFRQVAAGRVEVYAKTDGGGYKLAANGQRLLASTLPERFQKISAESLPDSLRGALSAANIAGTAQWGVVLSADVLEAIQNAQIGAAGGLLVIQESGAVILD